ncbi:MAG TPA: hypothetical protein VG714_01820 [Acidobacteriaceae bacterium]|nr:hypothetical protein [Acidobacteriaceae bacterium]
MNRIAKLVSRMYPSAWRARYGEELEGLMEDKSLRAADIFDVFWSALKMRLTSRSFVRIVLPCAVMGALVGASIAMYTPNLYSSRSAIVLSARNSAEPNQPVAFNAGPNDPRIVALFEDFFSDHAAMKSIVLRHDLYPLERRELSMSDVVRKMQRAIRVLPLSRQVQRDAKAASAPPDEFAFALQFDYPDPHLAQQVDADLTNLFVTKNLARTNTLHNHGQLSVVASPSLPERPTGLSRGEKSALGLVTGIACGLLLAAGGGSKRGVSMDAAR